MTKKSKGRGGDGGVGYCKPPKHSRFKKGQSGNPKGRPKGRRVADPGQFIAKLLEEPMQVTDASGRQRSIPRIEAVLRAQFGSAINGDGAAQRALMKLWLALTPESKLADRKVSFTFDFGNDHRLGPGPSDEPAEDGGSES